ncbi:MAG: hypothetical protein WB588_02020, partial [Dehalococcoidia bacterium]
GNPRQKLSTSLHGSFFTDNLITGGNGYYPALLFKARMAAAVPLIKTVCPGTRAVEILPRQCLQTAPAWLMHITSLHI